jgi:hypothetical protein
MYIPKPQTHQPNLTTP